MSNRCGTGETHRKFLSFPRKRESRMAVRARPMDSRFRGNDIAERRSAAIKANSLRCGTLAGRAGRGSTAAALGCVEWPGGVSTGGAPVPHKEGTK
jgi:hypothetical protein